MRERPRASRTRLAAPGLAMLGAVLGAAACTEDARPTLGGLQVDRSGDASFVTPALEPGRAPFAYPLDPWERGVGGETLLRIHISAEGLVDSAAVFRSSGDPALDSAALAGARRLRYRPARHRDAPIAIWAHLPVRYPRPR
ncbi:energy transducer TonB family protein [Candidatus Palauibacter sp.]|uniref:energy transducer TonB family protein n=1 Tax=Candidatus Palauibacter sp. TaxID=3101350 RepID=UPI003AF28A8B